MDIENSLSVEPGRQLLRHAVATLAYRGGKTLRGAPEGFSEFRASETARTPGQILAHMGDLLDWAKQVTDARPIKCRNTKRKIHVFQRRIRNMRYPLARRH